MERRWHHRIEIDTPATLVVNGEPRPIPCRIRNYSASGLFVETTARLRHNQFIQLHIHAQGMPTHAIEAMVIHAREGGVGVEADTRFWPQTLGWV